jgi:REP element-mobilizing transposase RayT
LHVAGGFYHVTLRGNHQEDLFAAPEGRKVLNDIVAEALPVHGARCHAFCWMTNHLHAFMQVGDAPLGPLVQRIAVRYARYRHKQLDTKGINGAGVKLLSYLSIAADDIFISLHRHRSSSRKYPTLSTTVGDGPLEMVSADGTC